MISVEKCQNPDQKPEVVKLVYFSMRNKYTSVSNPSGLTFDEVRGIIQKHPVHVIKDGDKIVGILNTSMVDFTLKKRIGLNDNDEYLNVGMIYISKAERGKGYASKVLEKLKSQNKNLIYLAHVGNVSSNKVAKKHLHFFKEYTSFRCFEPYNIYKIEQ